MATYPPPNFIEPLDEFNSSNWINTSTTTTSSGLTPLVPPPTGNYTYMNAVVNQFGQITSATSTKYPNTLRYVVPNSGGNQNVYTFTIPTGNYTNNTIPPTGEVFNWWIVQGQNTYLGNGYIGSNASFNWFLPSDLGYSFGSNRSTSVDINVGLATGLGICNIVQPLDSGGSSIVCPMFIQQQYYGTNPIVSIAPLLSVANNVPTFTITFTFTTPVFYGAMLYIQPLSNNSYPTED
jgi:hypothetical protein